MARRQVVLAMIGGGLLGLLLGSVAGAILGRLFVRVEAWETDELYGFFAFAHRLRGMGIGAVMGGLTGALGGTWLGAPPSRRGKPNLD